MVNDNVNTFILRDPIQKFRKLRRKKKASKFRKNIQVFFSYHPTSELLELFPSFSNFTVDPAQKVS